MPNPFKYSTSRVDGTIKKGNVIFGINQQGYGDSNTTGYYNGVDPVTSGAYVVYFVGTTVSNYIINYCSNDNDVITLTKNLGAPNITTITDALFWISLQPNISIVNKNYESITTSGLVLNLDASHLACYPTTGNTMSCLTGYGGSASLVNGPSYSSNAYGYIQFDNVNDYADITFPSVSTYSTVTVEVLTRIKNTSVKMIFGFQSYDILYSGGSLGFNTGASDLFGLTSSQVTSLGLVNNFKHYTFEMVNPTSLGSNPYTSNKIYINGVTQSSLSQVLSTQSGSNNTINGVGRINNWINSTFYELGQDLVNFRIYNRKLSQAEIYQNYYKGPIVNAGLTFSIDAGNMVSYDGVGLTWSDLTGNGYRGVLTNGPVFDKTSGGNISFDATNDYVDFGATISLTQSWSMNAVVKLNITKSSNNQWTYLNYNTGNQPGSLLLALDSALTIYSITQNSSGETYVGGRITEYGGTTRQFIVKLSTNGSLVSAFNTGLNITSTQDVTALGFSLDQSSLYYTGYNLGNFMKINSTTGANQQSASGFGASITKCMLLDTANNKVYIGGWFTSIGATAAQRFARLDLSTMTIDSSFNTQTGFVNNDDVQSIVKQPSNGYIIVGGQFTSYKSSTYNRIIRLKTDGSIDTAFNSTVGFDSYIYYNCLALDSQERVLAGGNFTTYNGSSSNKIIRLTSTGSIDTSFVVGSGFGSTVYCLAVQSDDKVIVGGQFTSYNGNSSNRLIRLTATGSVDTSFSIGTGFDSTVYSIYIQSDGKIMVGGVFTTYNGASASQLCRLNSDGTLDRGFTSSGFLGAFRYYTNIYHKNASNTLTVDYNYPTFTSWYTYSYWDSFFTNKWKNICITKTNNGLYTYYYDGVSKGTSDLSTSLNTSMNIRYSSSNSTLTTNLAHLSYYNTALTASDVLQNYNAYKIRFNLP